MGVNSAIRLLNRTARKADDVIGSGSKIMTKSNLIKSTTNSISSNMTAKQTKTIMNAGKETVQNVKSAPMREAQNTIRFKSTQRAINNMDEIAATSENVPSVFLGQNAYHQKIKQNVINLNRQQKAMNSVPSGSQAANNVVNTRPSSKLGESGLPKDMEASWGGADPDFDLNKAYGIGPYNTANTANTAAPNVNKMPVVNQSQNINSGPAASPFVGKNTSTVTGQNSVPSSKQVAQSQVNKGNTTQGNGAEPQFDFEGAQPDKVDPLDNQTRPKLGENVDWKSMGGKAKEFFTGGFTDTYNAYKTNGGDFTAAVKSAYQNDDGSLRMGRIAGSYMAAAAGVRILSGGGITKDRNGNNNLIGVPFI